MSNIIKKLEDAVSNDQNLSLTNEQAKKLLSEINKKKVEPKKVEPKKVEPKKVEPKKVEPYKENFCYKCHIQFKNYREYELHSWDIHPSNKYEKYWSENRHNLTGFKADDPYY